jgi:hypothetical protein
MVWPAQAVMRDQKKREHAPRHESGEGPSPRGRTAFDGASKKRALHCQENNT